MCLERDKRIPFFDLLSDRRSGHLHRQVGIFGILDQQFRCRTCQFHDLLALVEDGQIVHIHISLDAGCAGGEDGGIVSLEVGDGEASPIGALKTERGAFDFGQLHASRSDHAQQDVFVAPGAQTLKVPVAAHAHTSEVGRRNVHLHVACVAVWIQVGVAIRLDADGEQIAVEIRLQIVHHRAVTLHLDVEVALRVDDVNTAEVGQVIELGRDADVLSDDILWAFNWLPCFCPF